MTSNALGQTERPTLPVSPQAAELERKIAEANEKIAALTAERAALEQQLADAQSAALDDLIQRACKGDEGALRNAFALADTSSDFIPYDYGKPARAADPQAFFRVFDDVWPNVTAKSKFVWMLGVNGTPQAARRLRKILNEESDPTILGNAIFALSRCPFSPDDATVVGQYVDDARLIKDAVGYYPKGWYGADTADGPNYAHHPLRLVAREFMAKHDRPQFAAAPGELIVQAPTIHCAGFVWEIHGDANRNCTVEVAYRKYGAAAWKQGMPLLRCESWATTDPSDPFDVGQKLAGSLFDLEPNTQYEAKLTLSDPDGGGEEKIVTLHTIEEPEVYAGLRTLYVVPGSNTGTKDDPFRGTGTKEDPFVGIAAADFAAQPGDVMILLPGTYPGSVGLKKSGEEGKPIVWRGSDVDHVILNGAGKDESLNFSGGRFLHFENLSFTGADQACIKTYGSQDIVVRRCKFFDFKGIGIVAQGRGEKVHPVTKVVTPGQNCKNWFVLDNVVKARKTWTKERGSAALSGVNVSGERNIIAYNKITDCWDCISLAGDRGTLPRTANTDIYCNDLQQAADDGVEADYTFHNVRVFRNKLTNTFSSLSAQPTFGGPTYFLYNAMYNTTNKPFKLHVNSTGVIAAHNTAAVSREAFYGGSFHQAVLRNNLILGLAGEQGYWLSTQGHPLDMDYTGYNIAAPGKPLVKLNNVRYRTLADATEDVGLMPHAVLLDWDVFTNAVPPPGDDQFADPATSDITLRPDSKAVDAGIALPGVNDGFTGKAPDLGCYEVGKPIPHYGPRTDAAKSR